MRMSLAQDGISPQRGRELMGLLAVLSANNYNPRVGALL